MVDKASLAFWNVPGSSDFSGPPWTVGGSPLWLLNHGGPGHLTEIDTPPNLITAHLSSSITSADCRWFAVMVSQPEITLSLDSNDLNPPPPPPPPTPPPPLPDQATAWPLTNTSASGTSGDDFPKRNVPEQNCHTFVLGGRSGAPFVGEKSN